MGASRSWPRLKESNEFIHDVVETEVGNIAPSVKGFEDWDDIMSGSFGIGVARKFSLLGIDGWGELFFSYAKGDIDTAQDGLETVMGPPMGYHFNQEYEIKKLEVGTNIRLFTYKEFEGFFSSYIGFNWFHADTVFITDIDALGMHEEVKGEYSDFDIGGALGLNFAYHLPWYDNLFLHLVYRYDWTEFSGDAHVTDRREDPSGISETRYRQSTIVDTTGPAVGLYFSWNF